jgi:hypothetical protein
VTRHPAADAPGAQAAPRASSDAGAHGVDAALAGKPFAVGRGVTLLVPPGYTAKTLDDANISVTNGPDLELTISVRTDGQLATLTEPKQAALDYGTQNGMSLTSLVVRAPGRVVAQYQATKVGVEEHDALIIFTAPHMRVAALLMVTGVAGSDPSTARLIDELVDGRISLPAPTQAAP